MLKWIKAENKNRWIGFDDDCPCYFVDKDEEGWYWEDSWGFGEGGFETAEEAKAGAEKDAPAPLYDEPLSWEDLEPLDLEDLEDAYWDAVAHERMEIVKGLF